MINIINPLYIGSSGGGLVPTIRAYAPVGSSVSCDGQTKVVGADGYVDFVVSAEPRNILPDDVQGLESIESTGTQWIDTGVKASNTIGIETRFYLKSPIASSGQGNIYGARNSSSSASSRTAIGTYNATSGGELYFGAGAYDAGLRTNAINEITLINGSYSTNNGVSRTFSTTFSLNLNLYFFTDNFNGAAFTAKAKLQLYLLKMYRADALIRDFIPCIYNNAVGMWDVVSNSFFGNQGTGSFIAGEPKEWLDYPTYTVTVGGASQMVKVDKVGLFPVSFN